MDLKKRVLITGADGFIGFNLAKYLQHNTSWDVIGFDRSSNFNKLQRSFIEADIVFHFGGVNRPKSQERFLTDNVKFTRKLCDFILEQEKKPKIVFASSTQATEDNPYGVSKLACENILLEAHKKYGLAADIYRLPGVFGRWARPNYNSVVSTFCHNLANGLNINVLDENKLLQLVYIDDLCDQLMNTSLKDRGLNYVSPQKSFQITVGDLATKIREISETRDRLLIPDMEDELTKRIYSTFLTYLPKENFKYSLRKLGDERGMFVEAIKSASGGQLSVFSANPGVTRGGHFHFTKVEKFFVVSGVAEVRMKDLRTGQMIKEKLSSEVPEILETIPGWVHEIENTGETELVVLTWANEIFEKTRPDTYPCEI